LYKNVTTFVKKGNRLITVHLNAFVEDSHQRVTKTRTLTAVTKKE